MLDGERGGTARVPGRDADAGPAAARAHRRRRRRRRLDRDRRRHARRRGRMVGSFTVRLRPPRRRVPAQRPADGRGARGGQRARGPGAGGDRAAAGRRRGRGRRQRGLVAAARRRRARRREPGPRARPAAPGPAADVAFRFDLDVQRVRLMPAGLLALDAAAHGARAPAADRPRRPARRRPARPGRCVTPFTSRPRMRSSPRHVTDATATETLAPPELSDPALYFNRELSWLQFNERVLELAEDAVDPAARAREVLRDLLVQPRRVLHGPRRRPARPDRRRDREAAAGRAHPERDDRARSGAVVARARRAPVAAASTTTCGPALAEHGIRIVRYAEVDAQGAPGPRRALPAPDLPGADAAGGRARASVPLHLQPLAVAGRDGARPRHRRADVRAREGAQGDAAALRAGRRRAHVRAARGA